jgi:DNA-binding response OmpR family regulator
LKVLVIDDNREITDMLALYFETQEIDFTAINDGEQGLQAIRKEDTDLVLLDLAMPNFSGVDVVDYLKKENLLASKNIIIFTASSVSPQLFDDLIKRGIKGILKKPVDMNELENLVNRFRPHSH